jgi:hypothetical protein
MLLGLSTNEDLVDPTTRQNYPLAQHDVRVNVHALDFRAAFLVPSTRTSRVWVTDGSNFALENTTLREFPEAEYRSTMVTLIPSR